MNYRKKAGRRLRWAFLALTLLCAMNIFTFTSGAAAKKVALNKTSIKLTKSMSVQLRLKNAKGRVIWKSSDKTVATVSSTGKVRGVSKGTCKITARYRGKVYKCTVKNYGSSKKYLPDVLAEKYAPSEYGDRVLLAGSSSFQFWTKASSALSPYKILNMGVAGTTVSNWQKLYSSLIVPYEPRAVVLYVGSNDIKNGNSMTGTETAQRAKKLIRSIRKKLPDTPIFYVSICPTVKRDCAWDDIINCNRKLRKFCAAQPNVYYLDVASYYWSEDGELDKALFASDGLHPSNKAYQIWARVIKSGLRRVL